MYTYKPILFAILCLAIFPSSTFAAAKNKALTLRSLSSEVAQQTGQPKETVELIASSVFSSIASTLRKDVPVTIRNFGRFDIRQRSARTMRNPRTGEKIDVPAKKYPRFSSAKALKKSINSHQSLDLSN